MTTTTPSQLPVANEPERPRRKRRWLRWTIAGTAIFLVLVVGLVAAAIKLQPTPAPLAIPENASAPADPVDGTYQPTSGSVAGFRIQQTVLGLTSDVVGRTDDITGTVRIADGRAVTADLRVGLLALTSGEAKPAPQSPSASTPSGTRTPVSSSQSR
ncbi:hypothetical protein ACWKSP_35340 [Micromonosporaceae bacterium Da 78-11]